MATAQNSPEMNARSSPTDGVGHADDADLGHRIRQFRENAGISARELAKRVGLTPSAVSQIESQATQPSLTTLRKIAAALGEPTFKFFLSPATVRHVVVRREDRRILTVPKASTSYDLLTPDLQGELEVLEMRIEPGGASAEEPLSHAGEECLIVITGRCTLELGGVAHDLGTGDSATFRGEIPHRILSTGSETLVAISAISAPSF
jgi:transcriptional regulator with XRE-family HTH domain